MRRFVCIAMVILFFITIITGFAEGHVHPGQSGIHTPLAVLFVIFAVTHGTINRKTLVRHFAGSPRKID